MFPKKRKGPTAKARAVKKRRDDAYAAAVANVVLDRDGVCRLFGLRGISMCSGAYLAGAAHMDGKRKFQTRGMAPTQRHSRVWEVHLCKQHHEKFDQRRFAFVPYDEIVGADGRLMVCLPDGEWLGDA